MTLVMLIYYMFYPDNVHVHDDRVDQDKYADDRVNHDDGDGVDDHDDCDDDDDDDDDADDDDDDDN